MERSLLIRENAKLKRENDELRSEVDKWKLRAEEIAHINTYTCEQMNSPLKLIPGRPGMPCDTRCPLANQACEDCTNNELPADGPDPDMLKPSARDYFRAGTWGM